MDDAQTLFESGMIPENTVLIDLREEADYASGHIPGAIRITPGSLREEIRRIARFNTPILLYCYTGRKSEQAAELLQSRGYLNARNLGGIEAYPGRLEPELTIRELRERKGLSQAALARMIGVRQPTVAAYESGKAHPGPEVRAAIRRMLFATIAPPSARGEAGNRQGMRKTRDKKEKSAACQRISVRDLRKSLGLTQAEFAKSVGVCTGSVVAYENGKTKPGAKVIERIREIYGADVTGSVPERRKPGKKTGKGIYGQGI